MQIPVFLKFSLVKYRKYAKIDKNAKILKFWLLGPLDTQKLLKMLCSVTQSKKQLFLCGFLLGQTLNMRFYPILLHFQFFWRNVENVQKINTFFWRPKLKIWLIEIVPYMDRQLLYESDFLFRPSKKCCFFFNFFLFFSENLLWTVFFHISRLIFI